MYAFIATSDTESPGKTTFLVPIAMLDALDSPSVPPRFTQRSDKSHWNLSLETGRGRVTT